MDIPLPGSSLNKSITQSWSNHASSRSSAARKNRISLNAAASSPSDTRGGDGSAPNDVGTGGETESNPGTARIGVNGSKRDRSRAGSPAFLNLGTMEEPITLIENGTHSGLADAPSPIVGSKRSSSAITAIQASSSSAVVSNGLTSASQTSPAPAPPVTHKRLRRLAPSSKDKDPSLSTSSNTNASGSHSSGPGSTTTLSRTALLAKYPPPSPPHRLSSLGGLAPQITLLLETVALPLLHPEIYTYTGIRPPRGILLHGVPGGGKTRLVHCLAGELGVPFLSISAPSIVSSMSGDSERLLRDLFAEARALAPCILFLDEVDAITPKRENAQREMEKRIVGQLLTCLDDLAAPMEGGNGESSPPVVVMAATNRPDSLDPALRRAGRFDHEIEMGVPSVEGREEILKVLCSTLRLSGSIDFHTLAMATPGYVGADLTALTGAAGVAAVKRIFMELGEGRLVLPEAVLADGEANEQGAEVNQENEVKGARADDVIGGQEEQADQEMMSVDVEEVPSVDGAIALDASIQEVQAKATVSTAPSSTEVVSRRLDPSELWSGLQAEVRATPIASFLRHHPDQLTDRQLSPIRLIPADFADALKTVQPSAQREGFATVPDVTWADIGALHSIRDELHMAIVQPIRRPELFKLVGIEAPSGVLLWGPPGCGKTLLAKAVANESGANFISVKGPELLNKYVGESERAVRQVFARARSSSPCVIFFDELDALVPRRDDSMSESSARLVNTLLTELDGLDSRKAVYVVGATNRPDMIDPAMTRPGRLDKLLYVDLPTSQERVDIIKTHLKKTPLAENAWDSVAEIVQSDKCEGFSGADLAALVREAASLALRTALEEVGAFENDAEATRGPDFTRAADTAVYTPKLAVTTAHFVRAAEKTMPSVSRDQRRKYEALRNKFAGLPTRGGKKWAISEEPITNGDTSRVGATDATL